MQHKNSTGLYGWQRIATLLIEALTFIITAYFLLSAIGGLMLHGNLAWLLVLLALSYVTWSFSQRTRQLIEKQWMASVLFWCCGGIVYVLLRWLGWFSFGMIK